MLFPLLLLSGDGGCGIASILQDCVGHKWHHQETFPPRNKKHVLRCVSFPLLQLMVRQQQQQWPPSPSICEFCFPS